MFPISAGAKNKKAARRAFFKAFGLVAGIVSICLALILTFPGLIVQLFAGRAIQDASRILFTVTLAMGIFSMTNLVILYNLSRDKIRHAHWLLLPIVAQVILLFAFHLSLEQFSLALLTSSAIFFVAAVIVRKGD